MMLDKLFKFPIVIVDGDEENKKQQNQDLYNYNQEEPIEFIIGEAEVMYYDLVCILDRWGPNLESKDMARSGKFDHCYVVFGEAGSFYVPWTKSFFKKKLGDFIKNLQDEK